MNTVKMIAVAGFIAASVVPGFAENMEPLKPGEAIAIMPDGHMARVIITDSKKLEELKSDAKMIPWCKMLISDKNGNVYLINTDGHNPMVYCEELVPK